MWGVLSGFAAGAARELQVADELPAALAVNVASPHRGASATAPRLLQEIVLDSIEAQVVVEVHDFYNDLGVVTGDHQVPAKTTGGKASEEGP